MLVDTNDGVGRGIDDAAQQRVAALDSERGRDRTPRLLVERANGGRDESRGERERERRDIEHDSASAVESSVAAASTPKPAAAKAALGRQPRRPNSNAQHNVQKARPTA